MRKIKSVKAEDSELTSVLNNIEDAPKILYMRGALPEGRPPCVAIIGSRQPSQYGREVTYRLAYDLAKSGVCVISGLALGVDAIAHQAALDANGVTLAVMAGGLHRTYPATNHALGEAIIKNGGALITEQPPGVEARRYDFLARNRIISGLADAVVVTEATERSGTLSTVGHALAQNKEVFAVPGPTTSLLSVGPNRLLQQGAHIALEAQDILNVISPDLKPVQLPLVPTASTALEAKIIEAIQLGVRDGDELLEKSGAAAGEFLQALTMMELGGTIRPLGANRWTLR